MHHDSNTPSPELQPAATLKPLPFVFNSDEASVFFLLKPDDVYGGAHEYYLRPSIGFKDGKTQFEPTGLGIDIRFVEKRDDGKVIPGALTEQILIMLRDRHEKLNARFPSSQNEQFQRGITIALDALENRVRERMEHGVMGELKNLPTTTQSGGVSIEMPKYQSHKKVYALKIEKIVLDADLAKSENRETDGSAMIGPSDGRYAPFKVSAEYVRKHNPQPGGYFIVYDDGYQSWSPAEAFESGYTRIES